MKVYVIGFDGLLGTDVVKKLVSDGHDVDTTVLDITNKEAVIEHIKTSKPDWIVNCAAYTNVELCEDEGYEEAKKVNGYAPGYIADAAKLVNAHFIHISTNCVSNDNSPMGLTEDEEILGSMNKYGETKLIGEKSILSSYKNWNDSKYYILRISWLFGPMARNFLYKITTLAKEREFLTVVDDEVGCPVSTDYVAKVISEFVMNNNDVGIYHVVSSNSCSRYDFAKKILELQGIDTEVRPMKLSDFDRKANTSNYSILKNTKLSEHPTWEQMLVDFFDKD